MKVKGHPNLIRDENSNAILNTNSSEYDNYLSLRAKRKHGSERTVSYTHLTLPTIYSV